MSSNQYRHVIERIGRKSRLSEPEIAELTVSLAGQGKITYSTGDRIAHVGFYLLDDGLQRLEQDAAMRLPRIAMVRRALTCSSLPPYLGAILTLSILLTFGILKLTATLKPPIWQFVLLSLLTMLGASQLVNGVVNWIVIMLVKPQRLPRMDFSKGIAPDSAALHRLVETHSQSYVR
jgi:cyclic beta-1,2-glucan synthetase